jgi:hypothetical protein
VTGVNLSYFGAHGRQTAELDCEVTFPFALMMGTGYGLEPDWRHGMYQGDLVVQGQRYDPKSPEYQPWGLTENAARFTSDGQVGYGMLECAVLGPHEEYGFTGWE